MARQRRPPRDANRNGSSRSLNSHKSKNKGSSQQEWSTNLLFFVAFNILIVVISVAYFYYSYQLENIVITPLNVPKVTLHNGLEIPDRYWGTYRSGLYFGLQTRSPHSLAVGLMWFLQKVVDNSLQIRHWCNQWDRLKKYGWLQHDGKNFGVQDIEEEDFIIQTSFVKRLGGENGGDWTARISVKSKVNKTHNIPISILFYAATNGDGAIVPHVREKSHLVSINGETSDLGKFTITFLSNPSSSGSVVKYNYLFTAAPPGLTVLKELVLQKLALFQSKRGDLQLLGLAGHSFSTPEQLEMANFVVHQVTILPPFQMDILFESDSFIDRPNRLTADIFDSEFWHHQSNFEKKFDDTFKLASKQYSQKDISLAQAIFSNMMGSIGYFYGSSLVQSKYNKEPVAYWEAPLYTGVPSRSFFPRGFLWDEGFHNLLISRWDPEITKDIIGHWLDLMNVEGWIPREQILGAEARARVPSEFVVQKNSNANPPTFFLTIESLYRQMEDGLIPEDKEFLLRVYPRLKAWFQWFNITQTGKFPGTYRWRGRDFNTNKELNPKTLTSGLDDYPRASHPTAEERHIDLRCWISLASGTLADVANLIGEPNEEFVATHKYLTNNELMDKLHWSPSNSYSDFGLHTDNVKLTHPKPSPMSPGHPPPKMDMIRVVGEEPTMKFVDSFGYVSIFPFLLQIMKADSPKLGKVLTDMRDPKLLWTNYGLRSLSRKSSLYMKYNTEHDPPYWRGAVWININYLAVRALHHYGVLPGPHQSQAFSLYKELRKNLVENILYEYRRTGYIWEQYNDKTGQGQGSHPFTGWSALVVLIMAELY